MDMEPKPLGQLLDNISPDDSSPEDGIEIFAKLAELAYTRMYESSHPKDERDEALYQLKMALRIARVLKLTEKEAALQKRYEEIEAVFNTQFRR